MSIRPVTRYQAVCDGCGDGAAETNPSARGVIAEHQHQSTGWAVGDDGTARCPSCRRRDREDAGMREPR